MTMDIHKMRWKYEDCPFPITSKKMKPKIHPVIHHFDEMPEDQRLFLLGVKEYINSIIPDARLFLFGSRVNGNWDEFSDYDVVVSTEVNVDKETIEMLRKHDFGTKVDLSFTGKVAGVHNVEVKI